MGQGTFPEKGGSGPFRKLLGPHVTSMTSLSPDPPSPVGIFTFSRLTCSLSRVSIDSQLQKFNRDYFLNFAASYQLLFMYNAVFTLAIYGVHMLCVGEVK